MDRKKGRKEWREERIIDGRMHGERKKKENKHLTHKSYAANDTFSFK